MDVLRSARTLQGGDGMNYVIMALAFCSSALVGGIAIKNTFERFADEIKTEIAVLATRRIDAIRITIQRQ